MVSVPDLNDELTRLLDESRDEYIECSLESRNEAMGWSSERGGDKNGQERSNGSGDSQNWQSGQPGRFLQLNIELISGESKWGIKMKRHMTAIAL
ncbi:hypothetical protein AMTR_s00199p00031140 [Amborella trichopoda]|uniref:Uncharacterized protein n=1 Tax=Amborella trichopoda TaxID=13333 RepID=U5CZE4_AMBTC|nr:hypothetical protein AMTR_s00199p00031140 [Amborella trichopoda]